jgi:hypothetical protein
MPRELTHIRGGDETLAPGFLFRAQKSPRADGKEQIKWTLYYLNSPVEEGVAANREAARKAADRVITKAGSDIADRNKRVNTARQTLRYYLHSRTWVMAHVLARILEAGAPEEVDSFDIAVTAEEGERAWGKKARRPASEFGAHRKPAGEVATKIIAMLTDARMVDIAKVRRYAARTFGPSVANIGTDAAEPEEG